MDFFSSEQMQRLRENGVLWLDRVVYGAQLEPVAKLFTPDAGCTWLVAAIHPNDGDRVLALCDVADGDPQIRWTSLRALAEVRGKLGRSVERDDRFVCAATLGAYHNEARRVGVLIA